MGAAGAADGDSFTGVQQTQYMEEERLPIPPTAGRAAGKLLRPNLFALALPLFVRLCNMAELAVPCACRRRGRFWPSSNDRRSGWGTP